MRVQLLKSAHHTAAASTSILLLSYQVAIIVAIMWLRWPDRVVAIRLLVLIRSQDSTRWGLGVRRLLANLDRFRLRRVALGGAFLPTEVKRTGEKAPLKRVQLRDVLEGTRS